MKERKELNEIEFEIQLKSEKIPKIAYSWA